MAAADDRRWDGLGGSSSPKSPSEEHGEVLTLVDRDSELPSLAALQVVQSFD